MLMFLQEFLFVLNCVLMMLYETLCRRRLVSVNTIVVKLVYFIIESILVYLLSLLNQFFIQLSELLLDLPSFLFKLGIEEFMPETMSCLASTITLWRLCIIDIHSLSVIFKFLQI